MLPGEVEEESPEGADPAVLPHWKLPISIHANILGNHIPPLDTN